MGGVVLGSRRHSGRQDMVPQSPDPSSPKSTSTQLRTQMSTLRTVPEQARVQHSGTPVCTRSKGHLPPQTHLQRPPLLLPLSDFGWSPTPPEDRVGEEESSSLQASGTGALALRGPRVDELKYYGGSGARRSGGSRALSKRDGAGLLEVTPIPPCFAAPTPPRLRAPLSRNSAPPQDRCPDPPRSGQPQRLGCKCGMEPQIALSWTYT